jgi:hypothetical protein
MVPITNYEFQVPLAIVFLNLVGISVNQKDPVIGTEDAMGIRN